MLFEGMIFECQTSSFLGADLDPTSCDGCQNFRYDVSQEEAVAAGSPHLLLCGVPGQ